MWRGISTSNQYEEYRQFPGNKRYQGQLQILQQYQATRVLSLKLYPQHKECRKRYHARFPRRITCQCQCLSIQTVRTTLGTTKPNMAGKCLPLGQHCFLLSEPSNSQTILQMNPSVMPEVAVYCFGCNKTYNQTAVETLTHYVAWSENPEDTIRDRRNVRSRAFIDGFGAALMCFKNAGLSPGYP